MTHQIWRPLRRTGALHGLCSGHRTLPTNCTHVRTMVTIMQRTVYVTQKHARLALFRATLSPVRGAWPPARLALTRPASASRLAEHAGSAGCGAARSLRCTKLREAEGPPELEHCAARLLVLEGGRAVA